MRASPVHIEQDGLFGYSNLSWGDGGGGDGDGAAPTAATVHASANVLNAQPAPARAAAPQSAAAPRAAAARRLAGDLTGDLTGENGAATVCVTFTLTGPDGAAAATASAPTLSNIPAGGTATAQAALRLASPHLWSAPSPTLYTLTATVRQGACPEAAAAAATTDAHVISMHGREDLEGTEIDQVSVSHGLRELRYDADAGFFLNRAHFKVRPSLTTTPNPPPPPPPPPQC